MSSMRISSCVARSPPVMLKTPVKAVAPTTMNRIIAEVRPVSTMALYKVANRNLPRAMTMTSASAAPRAGLAPISGPATTR